MRSLFLGLCLALAVASGCDVADPLEEAGGAFEGLAAASTGDAAVPYVFVHESGETMAVEVDAGGTSVRRVAVAGSGGAEMVLSLALDGTPTQMVSGEVVVVFDNVRASLVDLVVITPDGRSQVARDVAFDTAAVREAAQVSAKSSQVPTLADVASAAGLAMGITGCTVAVTVAAGTIVVTGSAGVALTASSALGCAGAIAGVLTEYRRRHGTSSDVLEGTNTAFGAVGGTVAVLQCVGADVRACIEAVLALASGALTRSEITETQYREIIADAEALLQGGGGDVQVSLTWNTSADLDLWVTDPAGERIYYANRSSASGGQLDVDDTDGLGPENIFWASGAAPSGSYVVQVDHFSGASPSNYRVQTVVAGQIRTFTGTVRDDETASVTTFTVAPAATAPSPPPVARTVWARPPKEE